MTKRRRTKRRRTEGEKDDVRGQERDRRWLVLMRRTKRRRTEGEKDDVRGKERDRRWLVLMRMTKRRRTEGEEDDVRGQERDRTEEKVAVVGWLLKVSVTRKVYLREGRAQTRVLTTALRKKEKK